MQWMREHQGRKSPHRSPFENYLHQLMKCAALTALTRYLLRILRCIFEILKYLHSNSKSSPSEALPSQGPAGKEPTTQQSKGRGEEVWWIKYSCLKSIHQGHYRKPFGRIKRWGRLQNLVGNKRAIEGYDAEKVPPSPEDLFNSDKVLPESMH